jgi:cell division protein FtsW
MIKTISGQIKAKAALMDPGHYGRSDTSAMGRWFWEIDRSCCCDHGADRHRIDRRRCVARRRAAHSGGNVRFNELYYFWRQLAWIAIGVPVMIGISMM